MKFKRAIVWLLVKTGVGEWVWRQIDEIKKAETAKIIKDVFGYDVNDHRGSGRYRESKRNNVGNIG